MATSPTVLVDSSATPVPVAAPAKFPVVPLLIAIVAGALITILGIAGVGYYLMRSGRLPLQGSRANKVEPVTPITTHVLVLEPLLVNLADAGGSSYLRVALALRVADLPEKKGSKPKEEKSTEKDGNDAVAAVRDTTLAVLGKQTAEGLLAPDGKEKLKNELKSALAERNVDIKVTDVFFTDFLVQR